MGVRIAVVLVLGLVSCRAQGSQSTVDAGAPVASVGPSASTLSTEDSAAPRLRLGGSSQTRPSDAQKASDAQKEGRTHTIRRAVLGRLRSLARARGDRATVARVERAEARELERHRACSGEASAAKADTLKGTRFETAPCAGLDDGTGPYDADAIAASITQANAKQQLERIEDELDLPHGA